ncbi:ABC transporter permease [Cellulomonas pakistanensis]|uniref:ABC transporter permease n=1 Tax=Cellulomonas pakistanensis TaxID=992287 RepID=UPI001EF3A719|nr:ABC transporter permease [Cellulomonas pakistanensis]
MPALAGAALLITPLAALVAAAPWADLPRLATSPEVVQALGLSLRTATVATAACMLVGVPLGWVLARGDLPGLGVLRALVTVPLVLPPVVGGVALLMLLGRRGLLGRHLDAWFGVTLPFTPAAVVVAQAFVALPFLVVSVEGTLRATDPAVEDAAATLGAGRWYVVRRVTLPRVAPGIAAGAVLCFARALGEFGATLTFAGSFPGTTRTMPLAIALALERDPDAAVALSLVLVALSLAVLVALRGRWVGGVRA